MDICVELFAQETYQLKNSG